jgi:voltage-gated potassium channel Kch
MNKGRQGFSARAKYAFDNFMSKGGLSIFLALMLLFVGAIVLMAVFRFVANLIAPQDATKDIFAQWWLAFLQIADGGSIAEDTGSNALNRVVGIVSLFLGMILFSSLVAFITSQFEARLAELRKGRSQVIETGHSLILGFGDRVLEIIRELIVANESERRPAIVVLSDREKDGMDDYFRDRIEDHGNTRIITRSGSTSSLQLLRRVGVGSAKSIIILNDASVADSEADKEVADARVLKTIMAVVSCTGEAEAPTIVAELHLEGKRRLARSLFSTIAIVDERSILAKLMVQTSRTSGLAQVYDGLVGFEGSEFYFHAPSEGFGELSYGEIIFHYVGCSVLGIRRADGAVAMNPPAATRLAPGDEAVLLAEDDSTIRYQKHAAAYRAPGALPAPPAAKAVERQLIVGWSRKTGTIVEEYSGYLLAGSAIVVAVDEADDAIQAEFALIAGRHPGIEISLALRDIHSPEALAALRPEAFDNIIILTADGGDPETRDSETIAALLEFRHYFRGLGREGIKTQLITEVADSENIEVIEEVGVKDFMISNQFVSKIYAQVSEEPEVLKIYEELFSPEGSEVYIKPLGLYMAEVPESLSFGELCAAALARGETCFGLRILAMENDRAAHHGIIINPAKDRRFRLRKDDLLITLAEDET